MCSLISLDDLSKFTRSIHRKFSVKKVFLKTLQISQESTFIGISFNKVQGQQLYKRLQHRCFPVKFASFSRTRLFKSMC